MDVSFKKLRRGSRILLRSDTQTSDDEDDDEQPVVVSRWVILPTNPYRLGWDLVMILLVIYYGLVTPVNMVRSPAAACAGRHDTTDMSLRRRSTTRSATSPWTRRSTSCSSSISA